MENNLNKGRFEGIHDDFKRVESLKKLTIEDSLLFLNFRKLKEEHCCDEIS